MKKDQIVNTLQQIFFEEDKRIVFWTDPDGSLLAEFEELELDGVVRWRLDEHGPLSTKLEVERNQPETKFLLYAPFARPEPINDWLLDIRLYSQPFSADRASMIRNTLGLHSASITGYLENHMDFFNSKERLQKLESLARPTDREDDLDLKMITVLSQAEFASIETVTLALYMRYESVLGGCGFHLENDRWDDICKHGLSETYWKFVKHHWGYNREKPSLKDLFFHLTVTHLYQCVTQQSSALFPEHLLRFVLPTGAPRLNASVFISNWIQSAKKSSLYVKLAAEVEEDLNLGTALSPLSARDLGDADTFEVVERLVAVACLGQVIQGGQEDYRQVEQVISTRRDRFWCGHSEKSYVHIYNALSAAVELFSLKSRYSGGFKFKTTEEMFNAYCAELYAFDQSYRRFYTAESKVKYGLDILKQDLLPAVENLYCNWYMPELALAWGRLVEGGLLQEWTIPGVPAQRRFYDDYVRPILESNDTTKAYVLVSDAFRYEIGVELNANFNRTNRISSELGALLGVLPSSTSYGMAALLPHKNYDLDYEGDPLLDGQSAGAANREKILQSAEQKSIVVKAEDLLNMTRQEGRKLVKDTRVIYIYHDQIDAVGDKQATEENTFEAVAKTATELKEIADFIHQHLNGSRILITADHGFLFQMGNMQSTDKNTWNSGGQVRENKKRHVIGLDLPDQEEAWKLSASAVYGCKSNMDIVVPKGAQRFHFAGGARFVHGGAMLQEIVVPVLTLKGLRGKKAETEGKARKVEVKILDTTNYKVSNNRQRFSFLQTTKVEGKTLSRALRIGFYSTAGELVSDEPIQSFDSDSDAIQDRQRDVLLTLKGAKFDGLKDYFLVMTDDESGAEYKKIPFRISLGIGNEFGEW